MLAVKPFLSWDDRVIGRWRYAVGHVSFILVLQLEGDVKEPVTLFEKSKRIRMSWSIWLVPSLVWVGEVWSKTWTEVAARVRLYLRNSAIGYKWGKLAPHIFFLSGWYLSVYCGCEDILFLREEGSP